MFRSHYYHSIACSGPLITLFSEARRLFSFSGYSYRGPNKSKLVTFDAVQICAFGYLINCDQCLRWSSVNHLKYIILLLSCLLYCCGIEVKVVVPIIQVISAYQCLKWYLSTFISSALGISKTELLLLCVQKQAVLFEYEIRRDLERSWTWWQFLIFLSYALISGISDVHSFKPLYSIVPQDSPTEIFYSIISNQLRFVKGKTGI
jgi:hypothetical protein